MERTDSSQIKAFTLLELIVVLTISALVIALGYSSYELIAALYNKQLKAHRQSEKIATVLYQFQKDFSFSKQAVLRANQLKFLSPQDTIDYKWETEGMIRIVHGAKDTLLTNTTFPNFYYKDEKQEEGIVDQIDLKIDSLQSFLFLKSYSAASKMKTPTP